jgi:hypothetical protein
VTPDGISTEDWSEVHELAVEVVSLSADGDEPASSAARRRLLALLDDLSKQYGPLPSLLATRADYVEDDGAREYWLLAGYDEALRRGDSKNLTLISHSLAQLYVESRPTSVEAARWLDHLERHLAIYSDEHEANELSRLRTLVSSANAALSREGDP